MNIEFVNKFVSNGKEFIDFETFRDVEQSAEAQVSCFATDGMIFTLIKTALVCT